MGYIYKITNNVNGKMYIGKTNNSIEERFKEHCSDYKKERCEKRPLYNAMKKYGLESFSVELVEETDFTEEREKYWIDYYDTFKKGYNATLGGDGKSYLDYDLIIKTYHKLQNISETSQKLGVSSDSISAILKSRNIPIRSYQEISLNKYGQKIDMLDLNNNVIKTFDSIKSAARYIVDIELSSDSITSIASHISAVCKGKRKSAYKYIWVYSK